MSTVIEPRPYQFKAIKDIRSNLKEGKKHILVQMPTGAGKTVIFTYISYHGALKNNKTLILTDRTELLKQASGTMGKFGIKTSNIRAGAKVIDYSKDIYVAMSQTLKNRLKNPEWRRFILEDISMIIIDECHIQEFNYFFEDGILDDKIVLGFTATPSRSGKMRQLGLDYETMVQGPQVRELIKAGYLVNADTYTIESPAMSGVKIDSKDGDFNKSQMFSKFNSPKHYKGLVNAYKKYCEGQKMIVFCVNVEHAIKTTIELVNAGYKAKFVASEKTLPKPLEEGAKQVDVEKYNEALRVYKYWKDNFEKHSGTRTKMFEGFKNDEFDILVNVDIATKGYDEPSILVVAVMRATQSVCLWYQMIGRGSRLFKNKENFTILDFGGNKERIGDYDQNRGWSLWHETSANGSGIPPLKDCGIDSKNGSFITGAGGVKKGCERLIIASMQLCPFCGFKYPAKDEAKEVELTLSSIIDDQGISLAVKAIKDMNYSELEEYRSIKKYKMPWLWRQLWSRGEKEEIIKYAKANNWSSQITQKAINYCKSAFG